MAHPIRLLVVFSAVLFSCSVEPSTAAEVQAVNAANLWLQLLDQGNYGQSWDTASVMFRKTMGRPQWSEQAGRMRQPMGKVTARKLTGIRHQAPTGAPDGEYFMLTYETSYTNKNVIETLTPRREADGQWRVSGYFLK